MVYVGFGYLMTFLRRFGYSALGNTLLQSAIVFQWAVIMRGMWRLRGSKIRLDVESLLGAEFSAVTYLISFGALLGKTSVIGNAVSGLTETALGAGNEFLGVQVFQAVDPGGSIFVHTFGAYFGLAQAFVVHRKDHVGHRSEASSYTSDVFAMIGTLFLWLYWPSFNAASVQGAEKHRAVMNTYLALAASCVTAFAASSCLDGKGKIDMPFLARRCSVHDTCGVHNLHGMPGLLAGLSSIIVAATASYESHGDSLFLIYPARAAAANSTEARGFNGTSGLGRTAGEQAACQLWALLATLAIAISGGVATGFLIRLDCFDPVDTQELFDDRLSWNVADPEAASFVEVKPLRKPPPRPPLRFKSRVMSIMRDARPAL
ncbi:ammonium transporter Rh type C-like isoform X2 [Haemaphysalis longicornis]